MEAGKWLCVPLILALFIAIHTGWELALEKQRIRRLVAGINSRRRKKENLLLKVAGRLLGWYGGHSLPDRLAQAGNPRFIGESPAHFYTAKLLLAIIVGL